MPLLTHATTLDPNLTTPHVKIKPISATCHLGMCSFTQECQYCLCLCTVRHKSVGLHLQPPLPFVLSAV
jgi:hypothetical protein